MQLEVLYQELYLALKVNPFEKEKNRWTNILILANQIPYVKQFVLSKSTQYRKLRTEWRQNIYLAKSRIQVNR
jgi:hypothetical protein